MFFKKIEKQLKNAAGGNPKQQKCYPVSAANE